MPFILFIYAFFIVPPAYAADITATHGMISPVMATNRPTAAFFTLNNPGDTPLRLTSVTSPACGRAELHTHIHENGVMRMRAVDGFDIPANGTLALKPMGDHIMCFDPKPTKPGDMVPMTLTFSAWNFIGKKDAPLLTIKLTVKTVADIMAQFKN
jgi:periplasmic copper chaperone A